MKQGRVQWVLLLALLTAFGCGGGGSSSGSADSGGGATVTGVSADEAIERVTPIAFTDDEGPKVKAIVVEYNVEVSADSVNKDTYEVFTPAKQLIPATTATAAAAST